MDIITKFKVNILNPLAGLVMTVALVYFLIGIYRMFISKENENLATQGWKNVVFGLGGFAIIISAYGIIRFVCVTITACS